MAADGRAGSLIHSEAAWSGVAELEQTRDGVIPHRFPIVVESQLTPEAAAIARMAAGVSLHLNGGCRKVRLTVRLLRDDGFPQAFDCFQGEEKVLPTHQLAAGRSEITTLEWAVSPNSNRTELLFPTHAVVEVLAIETEGEPPQVPERGVVKPLWVAYGDSITQGANVTSPGMAWVRRCAQLMGWESRNLGIGGHGFAEPAVAEFLRESHWDVLSIHIGANRLPGDTAESYWKRYRDFLAAVRETHPGCPIVCVSPIDHRGDHQPEVGRIGVPEARGVIHARVAELQEDDPLLHLIDGRELLSGPAGFVSGRVHPDDWGASLYAQNLAARLQKCMPRSNATPGVANA